MRSFKGRQFLAIFIYSMLLVSLCIWTCSKETEDTDKSAASEKAETEADSLTGQEATDSAAVAETMSIALDKMEQYAIDCGEKVIDLKAPVTQIATAIEAESLWYDQKPFTDCSGIFHRVLKAMKQRCPNNDYPDPEKYRDSRDLARWYHEQGELVLIEDALKSADLIKPGAVLFFGHRDTLYQNFSAEDLFSPKGIEHLGVVVAVEKDEKGEVERYRLFHGQTYGKIASVSNHHLRKPTRDNLPPFGNWNQQWVAFAPLVKLASKSMTSSL